MQCLQRFNGGGQVDFSNINRAGDPARFIHVIYCSMFLDMYDLTATCGGKGIFTAFNMDLFAGNMLKNIKIDF